MKTPLRIARAVLAIVLVAVLGLVLYVLFGDLSVHKDRVLAAASDASGFYIASDGPFDLDVGHDTTLSIENVIVGNPAYPDEHPLASIGSLRIVVDTRSLIGGPIKIVSLALGDTYINLKQASDGTANWIPAPSQSADSANDDGAPLPVLKHLELDNVNVNYEEGGETRYVVSELILHADRDSWDDYAVGIAAQFGAPDLDSTLVAQGSVKYGSATHLSDMLSLSFDDAVFEQKSAGDLKARWSGLVTAELGGDRPKITTAIDIAQLYFDSGEPPAIDAESEETVELLFPSTPLSYSWLADFNLLAGVRVGQAAINGDTVRDFNITAQVESGALRIDRVDLTIGDGTISGRLHLTPGDAGYTLDVSTEVTDLRLSQLATEGQAPGTVPPMSLDLQLTGTGASLHDIMTSSSGSVTGRQGTGQLDLQGAGALFADMLSSVVRTLNPLADERTYADIECGILDIDIADGVANIEELALQSDRLTIVGSGKIDFSDESIDLNVNTKSREGLGLSVGGVANSFVKVGGTLREPALGVDAAGTVRTTGAAVATGGLSVIAKGLWDRVSSEVDLCALPDEAAEPESSD